MKLRAIFINIVSCFIFFSLVLACGSTSHAQQGFGGFGMQGLGGVPQGLGDTGEPTSPEAPSGGVTSRGAGGFGRISTTGALTYQVHVLGEVTNPGTYRVSPSMRVTDAIQLSGGIKGNGSQRFVDLRKQGQKHGRVLDLFSYKTLGNLSQNPYLQDNDTIFVPLKEQAVEIEGPIRRPGVYELRNEKSLGDLVKLAGGFTVGASLENPIKVVRYHGNQEKEVIEVSTDATDIAQFFLRDGDVAVVQHKFLTKHKFDYNLKKLPNDNIYYPAYDDKVFVIGGVKAPGAFQFNQYYTLRQYMTLAGGTTIMAKRGKIKVIRPDGTVAKAPKGRYDGVINPGDTIVVPEKSIPNQFYISLMTTIASLGVSTVAIFR